MPLNFADNGAILALIAVCAFVVAVSIVVLAWNQPQQDELGAWAAALVVVALAHVLLMVRTVSAPNSYALLVLANLALVGAFALMQWSVLRFQGRVQHWIWYALPLAVVLLVTVLARDNFRVRASVVGLVLGLQLLAVLLLLNDRRFRQSGRGLRLVTLSIGLGAVFSVVRVIIFSLGLAQPMTVSESASSMTTTSVMNALTLMVVMMGTISSSIGYIFMIKERADERNRVLATLDALTGIYNRGAIVGVLERDVARAQRNRRSLALLMIDVDHFKAVNDRWGHLAGDEVLRHVAALIGARIRSQDVVGRYGGEEFLVVLPDTDTQGAVQVARQLNDTVAHSPCMATTGAITVTVSIGVYAFVPREGDGWDKAIQQADQALYQAKQDGRNRVVVATQAPDRAPVRLAA